jgi:RNA polymerase sigma-70 factor (ECF subfamily)
MSTIPAGPGSKWTRTTRNPWERMATSEPRTTTNTGDAEDARRAAAGDVRAFERLYRAHVGRVHALARRMMGAEDPQDVTQEVFVRVWRRIGTFRGESSFGTWLHRVAVNVILSARASGRTERERRVDQEGAMERVPARAESRDERRDFERAIVRLPEGARHVFVLHDVEGFKHEEIAERLGVTVGTTKAQLHRARMLLRRHLES